MGCDIHVHVEIKVRDEWHHYSHPEVERDYALFGKMAGVRGLEEPLAKPRGIPGDATFTTRFDCDHDGPDGHSHSYLSSAEVRDLVHWMERTHPAEFSPFEHRFGYLFGNGYGTLREYPECYPESLQDFRFVFWFDN